MSRNDASLYSGLASPARLKTVKAKEEVNKPDPKAEAVLDELAKMKTEVLSVNNFILDAETPDDVVRRQIQRTKDRYEDLTKLEKRMKTLLGVK